MDADGEQDARGPGDRAGNRDPGVVFPLVDGRRSTTATGQAVFTDAARSVDTRLAAEIETSANWYHDYVEFAARLLQAEVAARTAPAAVPRAGLQSLHERFTFVRGGVERPLREVLSQVGADATTDAVTTEVLEGRGTHPPGGLSVPYRGERLRGDRLHRQLDAWLEAGTLEPSFADAIRSVVTNPTWLDLSDVTFVAFGAGAEMGPVESFSRWGADIVPVDLPEPAIWERILAMLRGGNGRGFVPVAGGSTRDGSRGGDLAARAGVDLIRDLPDVAQWLAGFDGPLVYGNYVYADGDQNVRASMAVDALTADAVDRRDDLSLAVLATPTDVFAAPDDAVTASRRRLEQESSWLKRTARTLSRGNLYVPNYVRRVTSPDGLHYGIADSIVPQQGPNYLLAKRLHRWRARLARLEGLRASINVAPPTRTRSVTKNRVLAAAYDGAPRFGVEIFEPETSRVLMAALLVHDLRNDKSAANPDMPLGHHLDHLSEGAAHGGLWRIPYAPRSVLGLAVGLGMLPGR